MSQIVSVKTDIKNYPSLEKAAKNLGYKIVGNSASKFRLEGNRAQLECQKDGDVYSFKGDSDYMNRGSSNLINELRNEYAKEEALAWAKFNGRTVLSIEGSASKGYDVEISA